MAKYICTECYEPYIKWLGKCNKCGEWNTIKEKTDIEEKKSNLKLNNPDEKWKSKSNKDGELNTIKEETEIEEKKSNLKLNNPDEKWKTLFIDLTNKFPLNTAGNFVVFREDLMADIIYEIGAELAFMVKEQNLSDKARIITDFAINQTAEYNSLYNSIKNNIYNVLLVETIPEEVRFVFSEQYMDWLYYNSSPIYSSIGKVLREKKGIITLSSQDIYEEYVKNKVLNGIKDLLSDSEIQKFTIENLDNPKARIVKDIEQLRDNFQYEDFTGSWVQCELGYAYGTGVGVPMDKAVSIPFYEQSAYKGNGISANWLGWCYQQGGLGVEKDDSKAFEWYKKGAELGNIQGKANLGYCYHVGLGTAVDYKKAEELYLQCIDSIPFTKTNLGNIYYNGNLGTYDYEKAFELYKQRSDSDGDAYSSYQVGSMYLKGQGIEKNPEEALKYLIKAEKGGRTDVYIDIWNLIKSGYGIGNINKEETDIYYKKAIEQASKEPEILVRIKKEINDSEYQGNEELNNIVISDQVTCIPKKAFYCCPNLKTVFIPKSVKKIDREAFANCVSLETVIIEGGVENIGNRVFENCKNLKEIKLGDSLHNLGEKVFYNCSSLDKIEFPNTFESFNEFCFKDCVNLKSVILNNQINSISKGGFEGCVSLDIENLLFLVKNIEDEAFKKCEKIVNLTFPSNVEKIGVYCFDGCINLKTVYLSEKVKEISDGCFRDCSSLEEISIHEKINVIGEEAFKSCVKLKEINIPKSIEYIGDSAFEDCHSLKKVSFPKINSFFEEILKDSDSHEEDDEIIGAFGLSNKLFYNCKALESIRIPFYMIWAGIIKDEVFTGCSSLKKIVFENVPQEIIQKYGKTGNWIVKNIHYNGLGFPVSFFPSGESSLFHNLESLEIVDLGNYVYKMPDLKKIPKSSYQGFFISNCDSIKEFKIPYIDTHIRNFEEFSNPLIANCPNLYVIDLSSWNIFEYKFGDSLFYELEFSNNTIEFLLNIIHRCIFNSCNCVIKSIIVNEKTRKVIKTYLSDLRKIKIESIQKWKNTENREQEMIKKNQGIVFSLNRDTLQQCEENIKKLEKEIDFLDYKTESYNKFLTVSPQANEPVVTEMKGQNNILLKESTDEDNNEVHSLEKEDNKDTDNFSQKGPTFSEQKQKKSEESNENTLFKNLINVVDEHLDKSEDGKKVKGIFKKLFGNK